MQGEHALCALAGFRQIPFKIPSCIAVMRVTVGLVEHSQFKRIGTVVAVGVEPRDDILPIGNAVMPTLSLKCVAITRSPYNASMSFERL